MKLKNIKSYFCIYILSYRVLAIFIIKLVEYEWNRESRNDVFTCSNKKKNKVEEREEADEENIILKSHLIYKCIGSYIYIYKRRNL